MMAPFSGINTSFHYRHHLTMERAKCSTAGGFLLTWFVLSQNWCYSVQWFFWLNQPVKAHKKQPSNISKISHQHSVLWYYLKVWFHAEDKNAFLFKAICQASSVSVVDVARKIKLKWYLCYVPFFLDSLFHLIADFSLSSWFYNIFIEFNTQCHFKELFI